MVSLGQQKSSRRDQSSAENVAVLFNHPYRHASNFITHFDLCQRLIGTKGLVTENYMDTLLILSANAWS
jgi:hypothetical protein